MGGDDQHRFIKIKINAFLKIVPLQLNAGNSRVGVKCVFFRAALCLAPVELFLCQQKAVGLGFLCSPLGMTRRGETATLPAGEATSQGLSSDPFSAPCPPLAGGHSSGETASPQEDRATLHSSLLDQHLSAACPVSDVMLGLHGICSLERERDVNRIIPLLNRIIN